MPGRDAPGNIAEFVPRAIFSQTFELSSVSSLPLEAFFELDLAAANQVDAHLLRLRQIRIDTHVLRHSRPCPSLRQTQRARVAQPDIAELCVSALTGFDRIGATCGVRGGDCELDFW